MKKYKLLKKAGEGTFSEVIRAQNIKSGDLVAIKCMKQTFASIDAVNNLREIQALRRLSPHPNIVKLQEVLYDKPTGRLALVFELMSFNLYELIRGRRRYLDPSLVKIYFWQLMRGLGHMHSKGIFHRDIKPENVLVSDTYDVFTGLKIADYGSCRGIYSKQPFTEYISTRWYRAPECLLTDGYYGAEMDIWGAACVIFEVSALFPLFPGTDERDQIRRIHAVVGTPSPAVLSRFRSHANSHIDFNFPPEKGSGIASLAPHLDPNLVDLLTKMLVYDPKGRYTAEQALAHAYFDELRAVPVPADLVAETAAKPSKDSSEVAATESTAAKCAAGLESRDAVAPVASSSGAAGRPLGSSESSADGVTAKTQAPGMTTTLAAAGAEASKAPRQPPAVASALERAAAIATHSGAEKESPYGKAGQASLDKPKGLVDPTRGAAATDKAVKPSISAALAAARKVVADQTKSDATHKASLPATMVTGPSTRVRASAHPGSASTSTSSLAPSSGVGSPPGVTTLAGRPRRTSLSKVDPGSVGDGKAAPVGRSKPSATGALAHGSSSHPGAAAATTSSPAAPGTGSSAAAHMDPNTFLAGVSVSRLPRIQEGGAPPGGKDVAAAHEHARVRRGSHSSKYGDPLSMTQSTLMSSITAAARELDAAIAHATGEGLSATRKAPAARPPGQRAHDVLAEARAHVRDAADRSEKDAVRYLGGAAAAPSGGPLPRNVKLAPVVGDASKSSHHESVDAVAKVAASQAARARGLQPLDKSRVVDGGAVSDAPHGEPRDRARSKVLQSITLPPRQAAPAAAPFAATSVSATDDHALIDDLIALGSERDRGLGRGAPPPGKASLAPLASTTKSGAGARTESTAQAAGAAGLSGMVRGLGGSTVTTNARPRQLGPLAR